MSLDEYEEPKGAYYEPALVAHFEDEASAESVLDSLREAGFTTRDIQVARKDGGVTVIVSSAVPGMLESARQLLTVGGADEVRPYGSGS